MQFLTALAMPISAHFISLSFGVLSYCWNNQLPLFIRNWIFSSWREIAFWDWVRWDKVALEGQFGNRNNLFNLCPIGYFEILPRWDWKYGWNKVRGLIIRCWMIGQVTSICSIDIHNVDFIVPCSSGTKDNLSTTCWPNGVMIIICIFG